MIQSFADLLDAIPDIAVIISHDRRIIAANPMAVSFFQSQLTGLEINGVLRQPHFTAALAKVEETRKAIDVDIEFYGTVSRSGRIFISPLKHADQILILLRDFTREQAVEKMRSDFVANASHEMRTPLASIIGSIETLQGAAKNDEAARETFLATMFTQAQRMKRLIDDLLTLSRIELNAHVMPNTRAFLDDVARQGKANLAALAAAANVSIALHCPAKIEVAGDADELLQVTQNLLENAIKYGGSGGRVEVTCSAQDGQGILAVRDFGKGIAEFHIPRLTERFYRVSTQESRSRGGTGLGLAIVKHILLRHRGKLSIISKEGAGSTFSIAIPLA